MKRGQYRAKYLLGRPLPNLTQTVTLPAPARLFPSSQFGILVTAMLVAIT
jgi:hypothetical protein